MNERPEDHSTGAPVAPEKTTIAARLTASVVRFVRRPVDDYLAAIDCIRDRGIAALVFSAIAFVATWFVYVPAHELLHAWGCLAAGGIVTQLDIAPEYGGAWLAAIFPFVRSGSEYAGRLSGFDTRGSDAIYLATVLAPYLLTILIGVPLMQWVGRRQSSDRSNASKPWLLGVAAVIAYAPAISLIGDYYEAGAIVVTRFMHLFNASFPVDRWRSDDLFKLIQSLHASGALVVDWLGVADGFVIGVLLALLTYRIGSWVSRLIMLRSQPRK